MTRDEAIATSIKHRAGEANRTPNQEKSLIINAGRRVDSYVALGMLKLDLPKTIYAKIDDAMAQVTDQTPPATVRMAFEAAGLRIVEK